MEQGIDFERERKRLTRKAWRATTAYVILLLVLSSFVVFGDSGVASFRKMNPNEVGDLLAGIAGPLAFIWLVYGYFLQGIAIRQQAQELSQNTRALKLQEEALRAQAQELKNSVEQQRDLVDVSRRQAEAAMAAVQFEIERDSNIARPIFILKISEVSRYSNAAAVLAATPGFVQAPLYLVQATLHNQGNVATEIRPKAENFEAKIIPEKIPSIHNGGNSVVKFVIEIKSQSLFRIKIEYRDARNHDGEQSFELIPQFFEDGKLRSFKSSKLD